MLVKTQTPNQVIELNCIRHLGRVFIKGVIYVCICFYDPNRRNY